MTQTLIALFFMFSQLSLLAFGGGNAILPEMQRQVVEVHQWMTATEFSALFALSQAAPGPNMMIVNLVGWHRGCQYCIDCLENAHASAVVIAGGEHDWFVREWLGLIIEDPAR